MTYTINISPQEAPRPRAGKNTYNPENYTRYKEELKSRINALGIPLNDYRGIVAVFYMPYSIMTPDKDRIETFHVSTPDFDNLAKPLLDALQQVKVIKNDSRISFGTILKAMTKDLKGRTEFTLYTEHEVKELLSLLGIDTLKD